MSGQGPQMISAEYVRDLQRGRDWNRFIRLRKYAEQRWRNTRSTRYALRWLHILEAIDRREPSASYTEAKKYLRLPSS